TELGAAGVFEDSRGLSRTLPSSDADVSNARGQCSNPADPGGGTAGRRGRDQPPVCAGSPIVTTGLTGPTGPRPQPRRPNHSTLRVNDPRGDPVGNARDAEGLGRGLPRLNRGGSSRSAKPPGVLG